MIFLKKHIIPLLLCIVMAFGILCSGCGTKQTKTDGTYLIYYVNQDYTALVPVGYTPETSDQDTEGLVQELLDCLAADTEDADYWKVFRDNDGPDHYTCQNQIVSLYFDADYLNMDAREEVIYRGAVVQTLLQIPDVSGVSFYVCDEPLADQNGKRIGVMTDDTFVDDTAADTGEFEEQDLTLYFSTTDGTGLVEETQRVRYDGSVSLEKLVMERLLAGPESENACQTIPDGTGLLSVSVMNGTCVVNLDETFMEQNYDINENVVIYSIVNSMTALDTVDRVQIAVEGETNLVYREKLSLQDLYEADDSLIAENPEEPASEQLSE